MPPARRKPCPFPGCEQGEPDDNGMPSPWLTTEGIPTRAEVDEELREHVRMAHELILQHKKIEVEKIREEANKIRAEAEKNVSERPPGQVVPGQVVQSVARETKEKRAVIPRPTVDEGITEGDWSFFVAQWARYKASTGLSGEAEAQHMWAACSEVLQRSLHNAGAGSLVVAEELMEHIKKLAVKKRNNLVNVIELQGMGQQRDEKISAFIARLNGKAELCDMVVECPTCKVDVTYKEQAIMYQLIRGMQDRDQQERVLQAAAQVDGGELTLTRAVKLVEALEMGKVSLDLVTSAGGSINRLSEHQAKKSKGRQEKRSGGRDQSTAGQKCSNCGSGEHSSRLNDRRQHCKAFHEECRKCGTVGHFKNFCKGGAKGKEAKDDKGGKGKVAAVTGAGGQAQGSEAGDQGELGTLSGSWFMMSGVSGETTGQVATVGSRKVPHQVCDRAERWSSKGVEPHSMVDLKVSVCGSGYAANGLRMPTGVRDVRVSAMADTGAQMCVASCRVAEALGLSREQMVVPELSISAANNARLKIAGAGF